MKNLASERKVKIAVDAIGNLNLREFQETLAIANARWGMDDDDNDDTLVKQLAESIDATRVGRALADLLNLPVNDYPVHPEGGVRFDTIFGDKTYAGLGRTVARVFEDPEFRVTCNEEWEIRVGVRETRPTADFRPTDEEE